MGEYNTIRGQYNAVQRKTQGSLAVRDVALLVEGKDVIDTENLTTLFVVVSKSQLTNWNSQYETLTDYVVRGHCAWTKLG